MKLLISLIQRQNVDRYDYFIISFSFPSPTPPNALLFSPLLVDAAVIAVVTYVVSYSVGTVFAAKHGYEIRGAVVAQRYNDIKDAILQYDPNERNGDSFRSL